MTALEVVGSATIWALLMAGGLWLFAVALTLTLDLLAWLKVRKVVWRFGKAQWVDEDVLSEELRYEAQRWWRGVRDQRSWSREQDFEAGMRAAAKHLLRSHVKILRRKKP